ncbi:hypothetical protein NUSPORA_00299 [Nucleospora cyclopteri]
MKNNDEFYDVVILGTGLAETALSALLADKKLKILVLDRSNCYGSEFSTLRYTQLEEFFGVLPGQGDFSSRNSFVELDASFNIDLTPKILLMESSLKDLFIDKQIDQLVTFSAIKGSYVYTNKLHSIPRNEAQSLTSGAISLMQKPRVVRFFYNLRKVAQDKNYKFKKTMQEEFDYFGVNKESIDFIGHGIAMNVDEGYLKAHPKETYDKIIAYIQSIASYDNSESPFIYPQYGLSDICQGFVRKAALIGAEFMLNAQISKICTNKKQIEVTDPNGDFHKIKYEKLISDPSYFVDQSIIDCSPSLVKKEIIRCIMICKKNHKFGGSRNITFINKFFNRKNDVFCIVLDEKTMAAPPGYEIAILSTVKETQFPLTEIKSIISKFDCLKYFIGTRKIYSNHHKDVIFTKNIDESPLMNNIYEDIKSILQSMNIK